MATPAQRYQAARSTGPDRPADTSALNPGDRTGDAWVNRKVARNGIICVANQSFSVGKHHAGEIVDVYLDRKLVQVWSGTELLKTMTRSNETEVRKRRAAGTR